MGIDFSLDDQRRLKAAEGWLELGLPLEANEELEKITPELQAHPDVLELRWQIHAKAKKWDACVDIANAVIQADPERADGWVHRSFALHELKRTQEAHDQLLPVANQFSEVWIIPYNLACYCSQLNRFREAQEWFQRALAINQEEVQRIALNDEDLKPMWDRLADDRRKSQ